MDDSVIKKFLSPAQQQQNSLLPRLTINNNANTNTLSRVAGLTLLTPSKDEELYSLSYHNHQKDRQYNTSNHLLELQKEIKEEEEEIFADINSLINRGSHLYSNLVSDDDNDDDDDDANAQKHLSNHHRNNLNEKQMTQQQSISLHSSNGAFFRSTTPTATNSEKDDSINDYKSRIVIDSNLHHAKTPSHHHFDIKFSDWDDENFISSTTGDLTASNAKNQQPINSTIKQSVEFIHDDEDDDDDLLYMQPRQNNNNIINNKDHDDDEEIVNYADELTFASCSQVNQQDYQKLQAVIQQVTSNLPKPCVFFLEGNCRRIDCKYSHDLSNITCKYWIEGFCFKGELCPFLHSYTQNDMQDPNQLDEDGINSISKKKFYPTFVIESEADFPSLPLDAPISSLNDSSKSSNDTDTITTTIKNQILNSNPAVVFKTVKKKRKRG